MKTPTVIRLNKRILADMIAANTKCLKIISEEGFDGSVNKEKYLLFTLRNDRFACVLKDGTRNDKPIGYFLISGVWTPLYKSPEIKGSLLPVTGFNFKRQVGDGDTMIVEYHGIILVQGKKYFGYNMNIKFMSQEGEILYEDKHIYGYGHIARDKSFIIKE